MSLAIWYQILSIFAVSSLPMSEKGVTMASMLVSACDVFWNNR